MPENNLKLTLFAFSVTGLLLLTSCTGLEKNKEETQVEIPEQDKVPSQEMLLKKLIPYFRKYGKTYKKFRKVYARRAEEGEEIHTVTDDGLETLNRAKKGDFVVKNQTNAQEMYIVSDEKFNERYRILTESEDGFAEYQPIGKIIAVALTPKVLNELDLGPEFKFMAPWGETMVAKQGDYLVCPTDYSEIYRIAHNEFLETYELDKEK
ncbi:hypothetical protein [Pareuzebyella sediminis]|uniref:hypothetical protein n=1 Tax=Pareuzebyella sediminis TaxID=2607998 RepID=UPI0011EC2681|nr:hypothetical protein [Pareuzebyella sediminis]